MNTMEHNVRVPCHDDPIGAPDAMLEASRVTVALMGVTAGLLGVWGLLCMFGGLFESSGAGHFLQGWLLAVTGK